MPVSQLQKNKHLLSRAGFGFHLNQINWLKEKNAKELLKNLTADKTFKPFAIVSTDGGLDFQKLAEMNPEMKREKTKINREQNIQLNLDFLNEMATSEDQLREKMAFFWNGHFATRVINSNYNQQLLNVVRENALGNFGDLLSAVSKSPSMLQFLNNQQNRKGHPNENFAREVMELFTLGRGNYTENDVKESARAFTGWGFGAEGNFQNRPNAHDNGNKTFLGKTGNFNGDDILKIILEQKTTAIFITIKIYKFFVNEILDNTIIAKLSEGFYASNYDIKKLMTDIFASDWFYDEKNIGAKIKSPVELIVGIKRLLPTTINNTKMLITYQKLLGQLLLYPPNVAGWPSGKSWIDSSTLLLRMQLPQIWTGLRPLDLSAKADDDLEMGMKTDISGKQNNKNKNFKVDWLAVETAFKDKSAEDYILPKGLKSNQNSIKQFSDRSIQSEIINLMSMPEYQLC